MMRHLLIGLLIACCGSCSTATEPIDRPPVATALCPVITRLVYRHQTIVVRNGPDGPTYTLESNDGQKLSGEMTLNQVAVQRPAMLSRIQRSEADVWAGMD